MNTGAVWALIGFVVFMFGLPLVQAPVGSYLTYGVAVRGWLEFWLWVGSGTVVCCAGLYCIGRGLWRS